MVKRGCWDMDEVSDEAGCMKGSLGFTNYAKIIEAIAKLPLKHQNAAVGCEACFLR